MANEGDALIRELEEEVRREKLAKLWQKYGTHILAVVALIVAGIGGGQWWVAQQRQAAEQAGGRFLKATQLATDGKADEAAKALEEIAKGSARSYAVLAELRLAGEAAQAGRKDDALKLLEKIAAGDTVDPMLKDYAALQAATLKLGTPGWTAAANRINDLTRSSSPWRFSARELKGLAAFEAGDLDAAREAFEPLLTDPAAPATIRARAEMVMGLVTGRQLSAAPAAKAN